MSIEAAELTAYEEIRTTIAQTVSKALWALAQIGVKQLGRDRDSIKREVFPNLLACVPDMRDSRAADCVRHPYSTLQIYEHQTDVFYFVVGDVHGDLESLIACADFAVRNGHEDGRLPVLVVLGDLIDRGQNSAECIAFLMRLALGDDEKRKDLRLLLVRGDHDVALRCYPSGQFDSTVEPHEFIDAFVNVEQYFTCEANLARAYAKFVALCCPAAALLSNGVLFAHGAVPDSNVVERIGLDLNLWSPACAECFSWRRLCLEKPSVSPSLFSTTFQLGREDFAKYIRLLNGHIAGLNHSSKTGDMVAKYEKKSNHPLSAKIPLCARTTDGAVLELQPVSVFVRGHDHVGGGYACDNVDLGDGRFCAVHTVTSFAERSDSGEILTPAMMVRLDGLTASVIELTVEGVSPEGKLWENGAGLGNPSVDPVYGYESNPPDPDI